MTAVWKSPFGDNTKTVTVTVRQEKTCDSTQERIRTQACSREKGEQEIQMVVPVRESEPVQTRLALLVFLERGRVSALDARGRDDSSATYVTRDG